MLAFRCIRVARRFFGSTCSGSLATLVYIAILPGMAYVTHPATLRASRLRLSRDGLRIFAIGMLGFFVWGHHMFISGMSPYWRSLFSHHTRLAYLRP